MRFYLTCLLLALSLLAYPVSAMAREKHSYVSSELIDLTKFTAHYGSFDLSDQKAFSEYLKITDCDLYNQVNNSPFKQQEMQQALLKSIAAQTKNDKEMYLRLPVTFQVSGYNFDTQAFPLVDESRFLRVNVMELTASRMLICNRQDTSYLSKTPGYYVAKLDVPISLYRIPLQRNIAESISSRLDKYNTEGSIRLIYGYVKLTIEAIQPVVTRNYAAGIKATMRAHVDSLDLYLDKERSIPLKKLDYSENY